MAVWDGGMWKAVSVLWAAAMVILIAEPAEAAAEERRLALVIGNSAYEVQPLDNPVNDAALMAETLGAVGFEVTHLEDLDQRAFERAIVTFSRALRAAGEDAVGLFYYAGHAIQADGENYLIPVDATLQDALDLRIQTVDASTLMTSLEAAGNRLNMVFLDACRNNPFKGLSRSGTRGLAKLDAPTGTLIAYSTAPGDVAVDGAGRNSPYTRALARAIREPGLPVEQAMKQVRIDVMERTGNKQTPWESSSLTGDFFFTAAAPEPQPEPQQVAAAPATDAAADQTIEIEFWKAVDSLGEEAGYREYLTRYPSGLFASLAQGRIEALTAKRDAAEQKAAREAEIAFFQTIQAAESVEGYETYLTQYPDGLFAGLARQRIQALETMQTASRTAAAAPAASADDETLLWNAVKDGTTKAEFQSYLDAYPEGTYAAVAKARIAAIEERRQVAALTPTGAQRFEGVLRGVSAGYGGGRWCGGDGEYPMRFTLEGNRVDGLVMDGGEQILSLGEEVRSDGVFKTDRFISGLSGSEPMRILGRLVQGEVHFSMKRGSCRLEGGAKATP
mgnify:CR=1 FL=1